VRDWLGGPLRVQIWIIPAAGAAAVLLLFALFFREPARAAA
jgi:hypothetical protein